MKLQIKHYFSTNFGRFAGGRAAQRLRLARTGCQVGAGNVALAPPAARDDGVPSELQVLT